jgi:hypothetical protein
MFNCSVKKLRKWRAVFYIHSDLHFQHASFPVSVSPKDWLHQQWVEVYLEMSSFCLVFLGFQEIQSSHLAAPPQAFKALLFSGIYCF